VAKSDDADDRLIQSVTRAFDVLFAVSESERPLTVVALSKVLDLPRPTIHQILNTLVASGVVARVDSDKAYVVTPKLALSTAANASTAALGDIVMPYLHRLVAISEETASLHVRVGDLRVCVAEVEGSRGIRWVRGPGWSAPIWLGAVGRLLLAGLSGEELDEILSRNQLHALASNTVVDVPELRSLIEIVRSDGWSCSESETVDGAAATAAPVSGANGKTIGVLSLYASADRLSHMVSLVDELRQAAAEVGENWARMSPSVAVNDQTHDLQRAI
jgi:IclR family acetate operon transcriptional repressor